MATVRTRRTHPLTTGSAALVGAVLGGAIGGWAAPMFVVLGGLVVVVSETDLRERRIPNAILLRVAPLLIAGLVLAAVAARDPARALTAVGWAVLVSALFYGAAVAVPGGLGMGDVKLLAVTGVPLGWLGGGAVLTAAAIGFGLAGVAGLAARRRGRWTDGVPFAPFHAAGVVAVVLAVGATP